jgi:uncharacterized protein (UPF0332 family)
MTGENAIVNAKAEYEKAQLARRAAEALAGLGLYSDAPSRLYYSAFHLVSAALLTLGVQAQSHGGLSVLLGQHLVRPGLIPVSAIREFSSLMALRREADYNRHFILDADGYAEELARANSLFASIERFLAERGIAAE